MNNFERLEQIFASFPGIGPRQAKRFVYYLLGKSPSYIKEISNLIEEVRKSTIECNTCHRFFIQGQKVRVSNCNICDDTNRDHSTLMIVARDSDFESIEKSSAYKGLYFILGGSVPILDKEPEKRIRLAQLLKRISDKNGSLKEIILSLNTTPEGEHTENIVKTAISNIKLNNPIKVTELGRGLSTGAELEYADGETIRNALMGRKGVN